MDQRSRPRSAVQGAVSQDLGAEFNRRDREISRLRDDPGHRAGLRQEDGQGLRGEGLRRHRGRARSASRGDGHRRGSGQADHGRLGRAEDRPGDHGLPSQQRGRHRPGGSHLQDLRRGRRAGHDREPLSACPGYSRHRFQERRRDRDEARHRKDRDDPIARRDIVRVDRGDGRGSLRTADGSIDPARRRIARSAEGIDPDSPRARTIRGRRDRRQGRRHRLHVPGGPLQGGASDRRSADPHRERQAALAMDRRREGRALGRKAQRSAACRQSEGGDPPGADGEGAGDHRRARRRQDDDRQFDPQDSSRPKACDYCFAPPRAARPSA